MRRLPRFLLYVGTAVVVLGLGKIHASRIADPPYDFTGSFRFTWSLAYIVLLALAAYAFGLPDVPRTAKGVVTAAISAPVAAALAISVIELALGDAQLPRFVVFGSALLLTPWYVGCGEISRGRRVRAEGRAVVLMVAAQGEVEMIKEDLALGAEQAASLVKVIAPREAEADNGDRPLLRLVDQMGVTVLVLDRDAQSLPSVVSQAALLHQAGVKVRTLSLFYEEWLGKLPLAELERVSLMFDIGEIHRARYGRVKRLMDIAGGVLALFALAFAIPFVWFGDLLANRGPLFYHQARVGKNGVVFRIHKFRSMRPRGDGEELDSSWTEEHDPRITTLGRLLRSSHIDELPQAWNIIRGELSLVGPRPEQPHYVEELSKKLPFYDLRHLVRPGLTGWAQVKYHYGGDEADALEKLQYEFYYLRHQRLSLDLRILGRTVRSVFRREGL
ncbi:MAG: sugar transferase [Actinobacteria bacterium]|nr:sugar transferase [Actinomycetota bacterium]